MVVLELLVTVTLVMVELPELQLLLAHVLPDIMKIMKLIANNVYILAKTVLQQMLVPLVPPLLEEKILLLVNVG